MIDVLRFWAACAVGVVIGEPLLIASRIACRRHGHLRPHSYTRVCPRCLRWLPRQET